ncbi:DUF2938 family protein [Colwellia sp. D2M02]|uniref:DUF2938 family protein n=1 Tax=Colwellia sp. D2M02 TaxID=2841562 RepID=UPI00339D7885
MSPDLLLQPCLGLGTATKKPKPNIARIRSFITHRIAGLGFYLPTIINPLSI